MAPDMHVVHGFPVVGIGASAGGITAIHALFQSLRGAVGLAFVVVQHLPPDKESKLPSLIAAWTPMPVREAADGVVPLAGHVYLSRPDMVLTIEQGVFRTRPAEGGMRRPGIDTVDAFLESLAADRGAQSLAVVLSGTGMDGAAGALEVRRAGGMVLVQDPLTALHGGMPEAAIRHGAADFVLPVEAISEQLSRYASPDYVRPAKSGRANEVARHLDGILGLVLGRTGLDFSAYKPTPLLWRIQQRMQLRRVPSFDHYESLLRDDPAEVETLVRGMPIHATEFFRDTDAWEALRSEVLAPLVRGRGDRTPIRAWTPACASGEEAYTLAMLLVEEVEKAGKPVDFQVFATDASPEILARASRGAFHEEALKGVSPQRRARFFYAADGRWRVKCLLREKMVFAPQDLLTDPPFTTVDVITCRNLLIYLEREAVRHVLFQLNSALRAGGCLLLGRGEPLAPRHPGFEPVSSKMHIYRKDGPAARPAARFGRASDGDADGSSEALRVSREELEASRKELEALNEELKASNEQLNVAVVDLEKAGVELQDKISQIEMQSRVLSSGAVSTLFLDAGMRVRWFTPATSELFPLGRDDEGRCIRDLVPRFHDPDFDADVGDVMATGRVREAEVRHRDGRWFLRRMRPCVSAADAATGVAITFTDITERKRAEAALSVAEAADFVERHRARTAELARGRDLLQATMDCSRDMIQVFEALRDGSGAIVDFRWVLNNHAAEVVYGDVIGKHLLDDNPVVIEEGTFDTFRRVVETGEPDLSERRDVRGEFDGWLLQSTVRLGDGVATTTSNITALRMAEMARVRAQGG